MRANLWGNIPGGEEDDDSEGEVGAVVEVVLADTDPGRDQEESIERAGHHPRWDRLGDEGETDHRSDQSRQIAVSKRDHP